MSECDHPSSEWARGWGLTILTIKNFIGKTLLLNKLVSYWILRQRVQNLMFFLCCDDRPSDQGMGLTNQNHEEG